MQNLLILCCYGGVPYIDYFAALGSGGSGSTPLSGMAHLMDPTDWIATDQSGRRRREFYPIKLKFVSNLISFQTNIYFFCRFDAE